MLGTPDGKDPAAWLVSIEKDHCGVKAGRWGCSSQEWVTGNYKLKT